VSTVLRREATLERQVERLEAIFAEAIDLFTRATPPAEDSRKALAAYLAQHLPRPAAGDPSPRHVRFPPNPWVDEKPATLERRVADTADRMAAMDRRLAAMEASAMSAQDSMKRRLRLRGPLIGTLKRLRGRFRA